MNENYNNDQFEQSESDFDLVALLFRYLHYWYFFVASVLVFVVGVYFYLKSITPIYDVSASAIIEYQGKSNNSNPMMDLENLGLFSTTNNFDNEIEILSSRTLIKNTIVSLGLYVNYYKAETFRNSPIYKKSPINVWMSPEEASNLLGGAKLSFKINSTSNINLEATFYDEEGEEIIFEKNISKLPALLTTPQGTISFSEGVVEEFANWLPEDELIVTIGSPVEVARNYSKALAIQPSSKTTTIANITIKTDSKTKGVDFINELLRLYNKETNDYKNEIALKTSEFINDRILIINEELGMTEAELESFKKEAGITDIESDARLVLSENSEYKQRIVDCNTQLRLVQFLNNYASNPENMYEVLPINVGLTDAGLSQLITDYNQMLLERKRLLVTSSENNPTVVNLDASILSMRRNVITTINSVQDGLMIQLDDINKEANRSAGRISSAPTKEREFISIARQQEIQSTLYLMLLQKREENALTLASTANNARIFNEPLGSKEPVDPNKKMYILIALILGLGFPMGIVYLKDLLNFKIESRSDIEKITTVPVLADIPSPKTKKEGAEYGSIVVKANNNNMMAESFRSLRTNMLFMFKEGAKVAMITSTSSGEGKSFISSNLAVSLALMGKKVIVVGLDIRKPGLNKAFGVTSKNVGLSDYLSTPSIELTSLIHKSKESENLSILYGGTVPPNPTELLSRKTLDDAIETLKGMYDYIILDTAPIGIVTDTQIISRVADVSIYVCRANYTNKSDYRFINELSRSNRLPNLSTVINGVDPRKRTYGYNGYGNKYGVSSNLKYGYGDGYGYEKNDK